MFFAPDKGVGVVGSNLEAVTVGDGVARAGFNTISAKNAAVVVDVVNLGETFGRADAMLAGVFGGLDINAVGGTRRRAEETGYAFLQSVFVALQDMDSPIAVFEMHGFVRVIFRHRGSKHRSEGDGKTLGQGNDRIGNLTEDVRHWPSTGPV